MTMTREPAACHAAESSPSPNPSSSDVRIVPTHAPGPATPHFRMHGHGDRFLAHSETAPHPAGKPADETSGELSNTQLLRMPTWRPLSSVRPDKSGWCLS